VTISVKPPTRVIVLMAAKLPSEVDWLTDDPAPTDPVPETTEQPVRVWFRSLTSV
jgi:hypothetical protein